MAVTINDLPNELIKYILSFLSFEELVKLGPVNKLFTYYQRELLIKSGHPKAEKWLEAFIDAVSDQNNKVHTTNPLIDINKSVILCNGEIYDYVKNKLINFYINHLNESKLSSPMQYYLNLYSYTRKHIMHNRRLNLLTRKEAQDLLIADYKQENLNNEDIYKLLDKSSNEFIINYMPKFKWLYDVLISSDIIAITRIWKKLSKLKLKKLLLNISKELPDKEERHLLKLLKNINTLLKPLNVRVPDKLHIEIFKLMPSLNIILSIANINPSLFIAKKLYKNLYNMLYDLLKFNNPLIDITSDLSRHLHKIPTHMLLVLNKCNYYNKFRHDSSLEILSRTPADKTIEMYKSLYFNSEFRSFAQVITILEAKLPYDDVKAIVLKQFRYLIGDDINSRLHIYSKYNITVRQMRYKGSYELYKSIKESYFKKLVIAKSPSSSQNRNNIDFESILSALKSDNPIPAEMLLHLRLHLTKKNNKFKLFSTILDRFRALNKHNIIEKIINSLIRSCNTDMFHMYNDTRLIDTIKNYLNPRQISNIIFGLIDNIIHRNRYFSISDLQIIEYVCANNPEYNYIAHTNLAKEFEDSSLEEQYCIRIIYYLSNANLKLFNLPDEHTPTIVANMLNMIYKLCNPFTKQNFDLESIYSNLNSFIKKLSSEQLHEIINSCFTNLNRNNIREYFRNLFKLTVLFNHLDHNSQNDLYSDIIDCIETLGSFQYKQFLIRLLGFAELGKIKDLKCQELLHELDDFNVNTRNRLVLLKIITPYLNPSNQSQVFTRVKELFEADENYIKNTDIAEIFQYCIKLIQKNNLNNLAIRRKYAGLFAKGGVDKSITKLFHALNNYDSENLKSILPPERFLTNKI